MDRARQCRCPVDRSFPEVSRLPWKRMRFGSARRPAAVSPFACRRRSLRRRSIRRPPAGHRLLQHRLSKLERSLWRRNAGLRANGIGHDCVTRGSRHLQDRRRCRHRDGPPEFHAQLTDFQVSPLTLSFTAAAGAPGASPLKLSLGSNLPGLPWQANARTADGGGWLRVSPSSGQAPAPVEASVDAARLAAGSYQGIIELPRLGPRRPQRRWLWL